MATAFSTSVLESSIPNCCIHALFARRISTNSTPVNALCTSPVERIFKRISLKSRFLKKVGFSDS